MLMACNSSSVMQCDFRVHVWSTIPASVSNKAEWFLAWSLWSDQLCKNLIQYWSNSFPFLSRQRINWIFTLFFCTIEKPFCGTIAFWLQRNDGSGTSVIPMHNVIELYSSSANTVQETTKLSHFEFWKKKLWKQGGNPKFNQWPKLALDMFRKK